MNEVIVAIDAGTTGVRSVAVDRSGRPFLHAAREFPQYFPSPGLVEHDAEEIWAATVATLAEVVERLAGRPVVAVGITNQRETVVPWSRRTGRPVGRAIVWQDRRTAEVCDRLVADGALPTVRERTGLVLDPYFSGTKIGWLRTRAGIDGDDVVFGTVDAWLLWNLTGGAVCATDPSNASRTLLYDIRRLDWDDDLCDLFGVARSSLPDLVASSGSLGTTAAGASPLPGGVTIGGIAGDQQAALCGQACFEVGMTKNTYGTGSFVLMNVGTTCPPTVDGLLTTVAWTLADGSTTYAYEGAIFATGATVQWLRDGLGIIGNAAETEALARSCLDTGGVYLVPAFAGLGAPWWDPWARGTIVGLTRGTGRAELARATVEAMAYQTRDVLDAMRRASGHDVQALRVDGGASVMDLLLQLQADQLDVVVERPTVTETTALGAAYLAGLGTGVWSSPTEVARGWQLEHAFHPDPDRGPAEEAYAGWLRAVDRSRGWARPD